MPTEVQDGNGVRSSSPKTLRIILGVWITAATIGLAREAWFSFRYGRDVIQIRRGEFLDAGLGPAGFPGKHAGQFEVLDANRNVRSLDLSRGTSVVMFYAPTCLSCSANMPQWLNLISEYKGKGVHFYGVSLHDPNEGRYWEGMDSSVALFTTRRDSVLLEQFGVSGIPTTAVVRSGTLSAVFEGVLNTGARTRIHQLLAESAP